jgi:prepilin-type processing-associated H-X9-DG protein
MMINCQSNLRQIYTGIVMYANDYQGALIPNGGYYYLAGQTPDNYTYRTWDYYMAAGHYLGGTTMPENPPPGHPNITDVVNPAIGAQVMACPAYLDPVQQVPYVGECFGYGGWIRDPWYWVTKGYVWKLKGGNIAWTPFPDYWPTQADRNILLLDSVRGSVSEPSISWKQFWAASADDASLGIYCRHAQKANCLFMDGHIEALTKTQLTSLDNTGNHEIYGGTFAPFYPYNVFVSNY